MLSELSVLWGKESYILRRWEQHSTPKENKEMFSSKDRPRVFYPAEMSFKYEGQRRHTVNNKQERGAEDSEPFLRIY